MPSDTLNATAQAAAPYDEMFGAGGRCRTQYEALFRRLDAIPAEERRRRQKAADLSFLHQGITFAVYGREEGTERIFPYDLLPRVITGAEWETLERGLKQRITALNLFLKDIYHDGRILKDGVVPPELVYTCRHFRREMRGVFKGAAESELSVAVQVRLADEPDSEEAVRLIATLSQPPEAEHAAQQQQQQQQQ